MPSLLHVPMQGLTVIAGPLLQLAKQQRGGAARWGVIPTHTMTLFRFGALESDSDGLAE